MVTNKILLFDGDGQIAHYLQSLISPAHGDMRILTGTDCDFTEPRAIAKAVKDFAPDLVINAGAMTNIDACEKKPEKAREVNFHAVANIAGQCDSVAAPLIHLSTNYVFDGNDGNTPYLPDSPMNPLNIYGQTSMLGEEAVRHGLYWHVILRTSLVFGAFGENILTKTLREIETQDDVQAASDQITCPTSIKAVAKALLAIAEAILNGKGNGFGTFHICGEPPVTRFDFLQAIMDSYAPFTERRPRLTSVLASNQQDHIHEPLYSALNCDKIRKTYGVSSEPWRADLEEAIKEYVQNGKKTGQQQK